MNDMQLTVEQQRAINLSPNKPVLIRGSVGSGKTTTAILRLNKILDEGDMYEAPRIAVFSFARTLINYIRESVNDPNVVSTHFHGWARKYLNAKGFRTRDIHPSHAKKIVKDILVEQRKELTTQTILKKESTFFLDEISWLKGRMINSVEDYLEAKRTGRGRSDRVTRDDKLIIWDIYHKYSSKLKLLGYNDYDDYALLCHKYLQEDVPQRFSHIIIDEAQDLTYAQLTVLRQFVDKDNEAISLIADVAQKIYKTDFSWRKIGINILGRSIELKSNYRNTVQIANAANSLLSHEEHTEEFTDGVLPSTTGEKPSVIYCESFKDQVEYLLAELTQIEDLSSVAILSRNKNHLSDLESQLYKNGYAFVNISNGGTTQDALNGKLITTCTIHSVKGLQFEHVFICDVNEGTLPVSTQVQDDALKEHISIERKLLYVGMTRAKTSLRILTSGSASRFLNELDPASVNIVDFQDSQRSCKIVGQMSLDASSKTMNSKELVSNLRIVPENIALMSDVDLVSLLSQRDKLNLGAYSIGEVAGEMLYRLWLYQENTSLTIKAALSQVFGDEHIRSFQNELSIYRNNPRQDSLRINSCIQCATEQETLIERVAMAKIRACLLADGMVMVVRAGQAIPVLFNLKPTSSDDELTVFDSAGQSVGIWSESIKELKSYDISGWSVKLNIKATDAITFEGQSLDLPILLAILKKEGKLPLFSHLQVCATGGIDYGRLIGVGDIDKKRLLASQLNARLFIYPNAGYFTEDDGALCTGIPIQDIHETTNYLVLDRGLGTLSASAATNELKKLNNDVHYGVIPMEEKALNRLSIIEKELRRHKLHKQLIEAKVLRAAIYCHLGRTEESNALTNEILEEAKSNNSQSSCVEALIRQIVNNTDLGDFETASMNIDKLQKQLEETNAFEALKKYEFLMKLHGSVGQMYMYWALAEDNQAYKEQSLLHLNKAVDYAEKVEDPAEVLLDLNYKHMWHVLFGQEGVEKSFNFAEGEAMNLIDTRKRNSSIDYLYRQRLYGIYRNYLLTGDIESIDYPGVRNSCDITWLKALDLKYKAALIAASGNLSKAKKLFEQAIVVLDQETNPLLFLLGMTIRVQAWQSFKGSEYDELAQQSRDAAKAYFEQDKVLSTYSFARKWLEFLEDDTKTNPQLQYQY